MTIRFSAIGFEPGHIYGQVQVMLDAGAELVSFYDIDEERCGTFKSRFPQAKQAESIDQILEDETIQLVISADIPMQRAPLGTRDATWQRLHDRQTSLIVPKRHCHKHIRS